MYRFVVTILLVSLAVLVCETRSSASSVPDLGVSNAVIDALLDGVAEEYESYAMKIPIPAVTATVSGVDIQTKEGYNAPFK